LNSCGDCGSAYQLPGWRPHRDEEVARALGSRPGERRRLDLDEPTTGEQLARDPVHLRAHPQRAGRTLAAQVEVAVLEPDLLADVTCSSIGNGNGRRLAEHRRARS
jgi:hypothetical protein